MQTWTVESAVARGVAWLDQIAPNWRDRVNVNELDLTSATHCVAGQVFAEQGEREGRNGYEIMMRTLADSGVSLLAPDVEYGFTHAESGVYGLGPSASEFQRERSARLLGDLRAEWLTHLHAPAPGV
jgi:hypothetical protein